MKYCIVMHILNTINQGNHGHHNYFENYFNIARQTDIRCKLFLKQNLRNGDHNHQALKWND